MSADRTSGDADSGGVILVVEDDDGIRLSLRDYLQRRGFEVVVASDGVGAIRQLIDRPVIALITDYRMSLFGGDYWIRFLRRFCSDLPVLVMSGFLEPEIEVPYPILTKPFDYEVLERMLNETLGHEQK